MKNVGTAQARHLKAKAKINRSKISAMYLILDQTALHGLQQ